MTDTTPIDTTDPVAGQVIGETWTELGPGVVDEDGAVRSPTLPTLPSPNPTQ